MEITLVGHTPNPIKTLYTAYRVCYSPRTPQQIEDEITKEKITHQSMVLFITDKMDTGHTSPLREVHFEFGISGISRALSHQLVRQTIGVAHEQQSQRYVNYTKSGIKHVVPPTIEKSKFLAEYEEMNKAISALYTEMVNGGIPPEDARYIFPNAATTNLKTTFSLEALQHMIDIRSCMQAQWEFRNMAVKMRMEVVKAVPEFSGYFGIKCEKHRLGYCDESLKSYNSCPLSTIRPHKSQVIPNNMKPDTWELPK